MVIVEATRARTANEPRYQEPANRRAALPGLCEHERLAQEQRRRWVHDDVLVPFRAVFSRLTNVDLADLVEVVPPGALFVPQQRGRDSRAPQTVALDVTERRADSVLARSRQVRTMLSDLRDGAVERLPELEALVDENPDYATYSPAQRARVAALVGLVSAAVSLMAAPLADESETAAAATERAVADARNRLDDLDELDDLDGKGFA